MGAKFFDSTVIGSAEKALDFIGNLLEASTEYSVIGKDLDGKILLWNEGARRLYGYKPEEVVGKANSEILHTPEDIKAGKPREILRAALKDGKWEGTIQRRRKNGETFTARVVITPRRDAKGKPLGYLLISKDISEEARLTEALKATQFYTRSLIESNIDALMTTDAQGVITDVNQQMEELTGRPRAELTGSQFRNYFTDPQRAEEGIRLVLREGKVTDYELTARARDGRLTAVSYNASIFRDAAGQVRGVFAAARDITAQRQASQYARSLIEASLDPLVTISPQGKITDVNDASMKATGVPREQLIGTDFSDYFTEPEKARAGYQQVFSQGFVRDYPLAIRHASGQVTDVLYNASVYKDDKGNVLGVFAAARDVTARKRAEDRQRTVSAYARSLIEASLDPLVTISPEGKITDVNQATELVTGIPRQRLIGTDFSDYFTEPERARDGYQQVFSQGFVRDYPLAIRHTSGRITDVLYNATVYKDDRGNVLGVFAAARDVTERKMAEELQRASSSYARSLIEASLDPLVTISPKGIITDVNQASADATGLPREQLIGTDFSDYFTEPEKAREGYQQVFSQGFVRDYPLAIRHASGRVTDVLYNASVYRDDKGNVLGVFAAARDVTERKRFEQTLQEKNVELESANLAKDRFLASMSHELRTPLNAIIGFTGTLLMKLPGPLTGDQNKQLNTIQTSARHLLSLINDLLDLAKIESGKVQLNLERVACQAVLEEVAAALKPLAENKGLKFVLTKPEHDLKIRTDRRALSQIVINLANNGIKFTEQGSINLRLAERVENGARFAEISVTDTGIGIRDEDQKKLFQAFEQMESGRRNEGTGLGLHLSQKLAGLIGARIEFESKFGKGSRFSLLLPSDLH